jgi:hypothetical protein
MPRQQGGDENSEFILVLANIVEISVIPKTNE